MTVTSHKVFVRVLVFGLVLGAASTANADASSFISVNVTNIQFTPGAGTATFTQTGASAHARAGNSLGADQDMISNTFPIAQTTAVATFASAAAIANATNTSLSGAAGANVIGCSCAAGSFSQSILTGTLVVLGGEGNVNVTFSGLFDGLMHMETDAFGKYVEVGWLFDLFLNGVSVSSVDFINTRTGPDHLSNSTFSVLRSRVITLQYGAVNNIELRLTPHALSIDEVPEPATVTLLISGLGVLAGAIRKRRTSVSD